MFRDLFLYFIKVKWLAESFNAKGNTAESKFKCYYDQKTIPDSKRIEIWREGYMKNDDTESVLLSMNEMERFVRGEE